MRCKLCGASSDLAFTKAGHSLYECSSCGFLFVHPLPDAATIEMHYSSHYYDEEARYYGVDSAVMQMWVRRLAAIEKHLKVGASRTILDVGCATGVFLGVAAQRGWNAYGVEGSRFAAAQAAQKLGCERIACSDFLSYEAPTRFSALSAWAVLEHVGDPLGFLHKANALLETCGVFSLSTVNTASLNRWVFGKRWRYFTPPEHLVYFNRQNLCGALCETGFDLLEIRTSFNYRAVLDGLHRCSRRLTKPDPLIKLLLLAPKLVSQWLGWGDIVEIWARKSD